MLRFITTSWIIFTGIFGASTCITGSGSRGGKAGSKPWCNWSSWSPAKPAIATTGARVCDVGCGYGATARLLAADYGAEVTAITVSAAQHQFASEKDPASRNPRYVLCDWLKNDLPPESFDAVIAIESSEHMHDKPAFFAEAHRVLRPGGRCVVTA